MEDEELITHSPLTDAEINKKAENNLELMDYYSIMHCPLPRYDGERIVLNEKFKRCKKFLDKDFIKKFHNSPNSRMLELVVCDYLLFKGCNLQENKDTGPDFCFELGNKKVWVEAVCISNGQTPNLLQNMENNNTNAIRKTLQPYKERISTVLDSKSKKYEGYIEGGIVSKSDIKIVAVGSPFYRHSVFHFNDALEQVITGRGEINIVFSKTKSAIAYCFKPFSKFFFKQNRSQIQQGYLKAVPWVDGYLSSNDFWYKDELKIWADESKENGKWLADIFFNRKI